jgi:transcriptional regulator with GAF, ATPase, and Fis domain
VDIIRSTCDWPRDIVPRVQFLGQVLSNALNRKKAEEELKRAFEEIRELKDRLQEENICLRQQYDVQQRHREIVGNSDAIKEVLSLVERVAPTDTTVLITGETGTGKGLVARAIHGLSSRKRRPLVTVNCAALPSTIVESELFGRERGAYTGALSRQIGRFEVADGSTIFLDEIGAVSSEVQIKLLQVLQEGKFERLGSSKTTTVDVRVIAATNRDLDKAVHDGSFREDLYYRLNVFPIMVPPLRERAEDIPPLVWFFLGELTKKMGKRINKIPRTSMEALQRYQWPGNVRELRNVVEQSMILSTSNTLKVHLPTVSKLESSKQLKLEGVERQHIIHVLEQTGWRVKGNRGAAEILGINPSTLRFRMKKLGIERPSS